MDLGLAGHSRSFRRTAGQPRRQWPSGSSSWTGTLVVNRLSTGPAAPWSPRSSSSNHSSARCRASPGDGPLPGQQPDVVGSSFAFVDAPVAPTAQQGYTPPGAVSRPSLRSLQQQAQSSQKPLIKGNPGPGRNGHAHKSSSTSDVQAAGSATDAPATPAAAAAGSDTYDGNGHAHIMGHSSAAGDAAAEESVAAALARAQEALSRVESSLGSIEDLPSAKPPSQWGPVLSVLRNVVLIGCCASALVVSHAFGLWVQWASAVAGALGIAWWGYSRSALSLSGAMAALAVGAGTLGCSLRFGATLLAFFFSSSKLTHFKEEVKAALDDSSKAGGQRSWLQVLCNGAVPTVLAIAYGILLGCVDVPLGPSTAMEAWRAKLATLLGGAFLGYYACCCGDTWASELGPLSADTPRLITTMRPVRRGTNGGVTLLGLSASMLGGMFIGAIFYAAAIVSPTLWILEGQQAAAVGQWRLVPLGLMAGLLGSALDSLLGATVQYTGFNRATGKVTSKPGPNIMHIAGLPILDNNMVNMLSATATAGLTGLAALAMFGA